MSKRRGITPALSAGALGLGQADAIGEILHRLMDFVNGRLPTKDMTN